MTRKTKRNCKHWWNTHNTSLLEIIVGFESLKCIHCGVVKNIIHPWNFIRKGKGTVNENKRPG